MRHSLPLTRSCLALGLTLVLTPAVQAALIFEDGFNYSTGNLAGNGLWTGASANIQVGSLSLTVPGLADTASPGGDVTVTSGVSAGTTKANFTTTAVTGGSLYYAFLAVCTTLPTANNYLTSLNATGGGPSGSADPLSVYVGAPTGDSTHFKIGVRHTSTGSGATYTTANSTFTVGSTHLFVVEYTFGGVGGTVSLFVDPTPGGSQPTPDVTVAGVSGSDTANLQVVGFKAQSAASAGNWTFDTVRIGDTWADVTPVPEPSSLALMGLAVGMLLLRRPRC